MTGMLVAFTVKEEQGYFCAPCLRKVYGEAQSHNALCGWWGVKSFLCNIAGLIANATEYKRAKAAPALGAGATEEQIRAERQRQWRRTRAGGARSLFLYAALLLFLGIAGLAISAVQPDSPAAKSDGVPVGTLVCLGFLSVGGLLIWLGMRRRRAALHGPAPRSPGDEPPPVPRRPGSRGRGRG